MSFMNNKGEIGDFPLILLILGAIMVLIMVSLSLFPHSPIFIKSPPISQLATSPQTFNNTLIRISGIFAVSPTGLPVLKDGRGYYVYLELKGEIVNGYFWVSDNNNTVLKEGQKYAFSGKMEQFKKPPHWRFK